MRFLQEFRCGKVECYFFDKILDVVKDVGGALSGFGGVANAIGGFVGAKEQQDTSMEMAQKQMDFQASQNQIARDFGAQQIADMQRFQERMSNSAYVRATQDMRAAGINPMLAYQRGGASSPAGGAAVSPTASGAMGQAQNVLGSAVSAGVASSMAMKRLDADLENLDADTRLKESARVLNSELTGKAGDEARLAREKAQNEEVVRETLKSENVSASAMASRASLVEEFMKSPVGKWITMLGIGGKEINPLLGSGNSARNFIGR